jgi:hypothetical protein
MATNDEDIIRADMPAYMNDALGLIYAEIQKGETNYIGMMQRLAVIIDDKSRAETAKQIFEVLNSFIEPIEIYDKDGSIMDMPTMNLIKYLEYQKQCKKKYGVD